MEDGRGSRANECGPPLKAGKGKETDSPLEPPEKNEVLPMMLAH